MVPGIHCVVIASGANDAKDATPIMGAGTEAALSLQTA